MSPFPQESRVREQSKAPRPPHGLTASWHHHHSPCLWVGGTDGEWGRPGGQLVGLGSDLGGFGGAATAGIHGVAAPGPAGGSLGGAGSEGSSWGSSWGEQGLAGGSGVQLGVLGSGDAKARCNWWLLRSWGGSWDPGDGEGAAPGGQPMGSGSGWGLLGSGQQLQGALVVSCRVPLGALGVWVMAVGSSWGL